MRPRALALGLAFVLLAAALRLPAAAADLLPTPPLPEVSAAGSDDARRAAVDDGLRRAGLDPAARGERLAALTAEDLAVVGESPDQVRLAAGEIKPVWLLIAGAITIVIIAVLML